MIQEAGQRRLVEAEHLADVGDDVRVEAACAAIGAAGWPAPTSAPPAPVMRPVGADAVALQLGDHLLDRAAGRELHDAKLIAMMPNSVGITSSSRRSR